MVAPERLNIPDCGFRREGPGGLKPSLETYPLGALSPLGMIYLK